MKKSLLSIIFLLIVSGSIFYILDNKKEKQVTTDQVFCDSIFNKPHKENFMDELTWKSYVTSNRCVFDIGNKREFAFTFNNTGTEKDPVFVLEISDSKNKTKQTIPLAYAWSYNIDTINLHDDINFDGYKDMLFRVLSPRAAEYTYYTFNPETNLFEANEALSFIFSPNFDPVKKTITVTPDIPNYYTDDNGEQQYYTPEQQTRRFKFEGGSWQVVEKEGSDKL